MNDLISRQAAIDALNEVSEHYTAKGREWHPHVDFMIAAIKELPSVQSIADVVEKERYDRLLENANILADAVRKYQTTDVPERNVGKWEVYYDDDDPQDGIWKCSSCGYIRFVDDSSPTDFCPRCGADMRGGDDG